MTAAGPRLVLASGSPRRRELLGRLGLDFEVRPTDTDERVLPGETPREVVLRLARAKALAACRAGERALGADTVVAIDGRVLGKPADAPEAVEMLESLSGRRHEVWTGVALVVRGDSGEGGNGIVREWVEACRTEVVFRKIGGEEIAAYVASGEPFDRAGAYAIQGGAAKFVAAVEGDYENVVGLPLALVRALLEEPE